MKINNKQTKKFNEFSQKYSKLSFYEKPPECNVSLSDFENSAIDRLKVLREIEKTKLRGNKDQERVLKAIKKYLPIPGDNDQENWKKMVEKDVMSHFTLRLVYCGKENRQWFITHEKELLKIRLKLMNEGDLQYFMMENKLDYPHPTSEDLQENRRELEQMNKYLTPGLPNEKGLELTPENYYKIPFEEALPLVSHRKAFLRNGYVYVSKNKAISLILEDFKQRLELALDRAIKFQSVWSKDKRIEELTEAIPKMYIGKDYSNSTTREIDIENLDQLVDKSYPLCMFHLHRTLRKTHHLKHGGRLQYGLFLKGMGLSLENSLIFWKSELLRSPKGFIKEYEYNIRHSYGAVGKGTSYSPYSCNKIINLSLTVDDYHGCPFKTFNRNSLTTILKDKGLTTAELKQVLQVVDERNYMGACKVVFDITHPGTANDFSLTHPNKYFEKSWKTFNQPAQVPQRKPVKSTIHLTY